MNHGSQCLQSDTEDDADVIEVRKTRNFEDWFASLRDQQARLRVLVRIDRLAYGNPGQHRVLAGGVCEMKIDHGPGYRVYYTKHGDAWVLLLCGGDKASQRADIKAAQALAKELEN